MTISISNALRETWIVCGAFLIASIVSIRKKSGTEFFPVSITNELKGIAILLVIFSHIGYFLVSDHSFLVPLSNFAGVGVDLFLLLSGYGLATSQLRHHLSIKKFYKKRLNKTYIGVTIVLLLLLATDFIFLHRTYPFFLTLKNLLGFFPEADLYQQINSPLWFITPLLFYYLIFPIFFQRRFPLISAGFFALAGYYITGLNLHSLIGVTLGVAKLYQLHFLAFPVGIAAAALVQAPTTATAFCHRLIQSITQHKITQIVLFVLCLIGLYFLLTHSGVGKTWQTEEYTSIATALLITLVFILKNFQFTFLGLIGSYSFEMYLLHWPLLYRYNFTYGKLPAGLATVLSLVICLLAAAALHRLAYLRLKPKSTLRPEL